MPDYQNPQQDPGMERRLLLAFAITFIVLMIFEPLLTKYFKPPAPASQPAKTAPAPAPPVPPASAPAAAPTAPTAAKGKAAKGKKEAPPAEATKQASSETETVVENNFYKITFSNRGAQVKSWILKKYTDDAGKPLELVDQAAAAQFGYPLSLYTYDGDLRQKLASALYVATRSLPGNSIGGQLFDIRKPPQPGEIQGTLRPPVRLMFEYSDGGLDVRKSFDFDDSYVVTVDTEVRQNGALVQAFPAWPAGMGDETTPASYASGRVAYQYGDKTERLAIKKVSGGGTISGPFQWAGSMDQYFAAVFLPSDPATARMVTFRNSIQAPVQPGSKQTRAEDVLGAAVGDANGPTRERIFAGPKDLRVLEAISTTPAGGQTPDLRQLVDFGFWNVIARPLFIWLRWTHDIGVTNWGWAIIVQTIIINLVLFPLRLTSMRSALKMQKAQPQINAIKKKYEKFSMRDPRRQEMNQEIQALFKREGVNPAGGCLPMLIQFPFLIAYYTMLEVAIELRHANWLWLKDLSAADPTHILPIGIIVSTLFVQKMTPQAGMDPSQQKIMTLFMPVMLGVIAWNLSSGLGVYWVVGNVIAIGQQYFMNRTSLGREMRQEAEKRARKKAKA